jgi:S-disulfanyl-L-cysteine oxidoreductase SoxD
MCKLLDLIAAVTLMCVAGSSAAQTGSKYPGIGRVATPLEVKAWDIDVRADFKGLPSGSGSVAQGQDIWEAKCASCHGVFGESNEVYSPLVGGTTANDVKTGRVARLLDPSFPGRTTLMKVATLSSLWDYINRAMPWNQPKSLSADEVYAVTAFMLNLGNIVPDDFILSDKTMSQAQSRMPNRNGMTTAHALWPGKEFGGKANPDALASACMRNCTTEPTVASFIPDFARSAHGNLAEQNRSVGAQRGVDTRPPETGVNAGSLNTAASSVKVRQSNAAADVAIALTARHTCNACHGMNQKTIGPSFAEISKKYTGQVDYLIRKIKSGGAGLWGPVMMPPQTLPDTDARAIAEWLAAGIARQ